MSQAILTPGRRLRGGRVKRYTFSPGRLERLHLSVWRVPSAEGLIRAKLEGQAYVACGAGNVHYPQVEVDIGGHPRNADSANLIGALNGDLELALDLAEELEDAALADWYDPCEAEGLTEEED